MTAELGTILGLSIPVVLSVIGVAWRMGRVEGRLSGVGAISVERIQADIHRLRDDIDRLRDDVKAILLRLPAKARIGRWTTRGPTPQRTGKHEPDLLRIYAMPQPIPDSPERIALACIQGLSETDWDYLGTSNLNHSLQRPSKSDRRRLG